MQIPASLLRDEDEAPSSSGPLQIPASLLKAEDVGESKGAPLQIPEELLPSDYTKQKPLRETGELIGKIAARSYEQSIQ